MKSPALFLTTILACASAQALNLKQFENQPQWSRTQVIPKGFLDEIPVYDTGSGLRLERGQSLRTSAVVEFPISLKNEVARGGAREACTSPSQMKTREKYTLRMNAYPLAARSQLRLENGSTVAASTLLNPPEIQAISLAIIRTSRLTLSEDGTFNEDPLVATLGKPHSYLQAVEEKLSAQLRAQMSVIGQTGLAELDLTGMPTIACDVALGTLKINVQTEIAFEPGALETFQFVQYPELRSLYEILSANPDKGTGYKSLVFVGVKLGQALDRSGVRFENLNLSRVWKIFSAVFDFKLSSFEFRLRELDQDGLKNVTQQIVELIPPASDTVMGRIDVRPVNIEAKGGGL